MAVGMFTFKVNIMVRKKLKRKTTSIMYRPVRISNLRHCYRAKYVSNIHAYIGNR